MTEMAAMRTAARSIPRVELMPVEKCDSRIRSLSREHGVTEL